MANKFSNSPNVIKLAKNRGPGPGKCGDCPVRDICPLEYDGNEKFSEEQAQKADYVAFQLGMLGAVVDVPPKDIIQTQPWTLNPQPTMPKQDIEDFRQLYSILSPMLVAEASGGVTPNVPAAQA